MKNLTENKIFPVTTSVKGAAETGNSDLITICESCQLLSFQGGRIVNKKISEHGCLRSSNLTGQLP